MNEIKDLIIEYILTRTSFYGLSHILKTNFLIGKIYWSMIIIVCIGFLSFTMITSILDFFKFEVVTKIQFNPEVVSRFPAVAICNQNPFATNYSNQILKNFFDQPDIKSYLNKSNGINLKNLIEIKFLAQAFANNLTIDHKKKIGYEINETILACTFNLEICDLSEFQSYYDFFYGNCFVFNSFKENTEKDSSKLKNVSFVRKIHGLHLDLFVGYNQPEYNSIFDQGARITVFNQSDDYFRNEIDVSVGFQANIGIQRTFIYKKDFPHSKCQNLEHKDISKYSKVLMNLGQTYHQSSCEIICFQDFVKKNCSCYDPTYGIIENYRPCSSNDSICQLHSFKYFFGSSDEFKKCNEYCPLECNSIKYSLIPSQIDYPSKGVADIFKRESGIRAKFNNSSNISYEDLERSIVSLNIFYDELGYYTINEIPQTDWNTLISSLGGSLGLVLGISVLSLFEIFEILFLILKKIYENISLKNQIRVF